MKVSVYLEVEADSVSDAVSRVLVGLEKEILVTEVNAHEAVSYDDSPAAVVSGRQLAPVNLS